MVALLFSTGQHRKGTEAVIQHTVAVSPKADREKMIRGLNFNEDGLLLDWDLSRCKISALPGSFSALVCTGYLYLQYNQLDSLPANFGELEVGGSLYLHFNELESLPADFGELEVGGNLWLDSNQLESLPANFAELTVGGNLSLISNPLQSLPEGFGNISVGGDLFLDDNQWTQQACTFPNVQGEVQFEDPFEY